MGFDDRYDGRLAEERCAGEGGHKAGAGERGEGPAEPGAVGERWQGQRGDKAAERDVRLADPECQAALGRGEPVHHRPAARGVDARAECAGRHE